LRKAFFFASEAEELIVAFATGLINGGRNIKKKSEKNRGNNPPSDFERSSLKIYNLRKYLRKTLN
jgi:hypothetical protein